MRRPLAAAGIVFILILFIIQMIFPKTAPDISEYDGKTAVFSGTLNRIEHKKKNDAVRIMWYLGDIARDNDSPVTVRIPDNCMILCYMAEDTRDIPLGSPVTVKGRISSFQAPSNPGQFDMKQYYDIRHISAALFSAELLSCDSDDLSFSWKIMNRLSRIRMHIGSLCDLCFDEADASVIKAMLLGDKGAMSPDVRNMYSRNGIAHILAISGLHISMLGTGLVTVLKKMRIPVWIASSLAILLMIFYGLMTGMAASAMRAVIMFSLRMTADIIHRTYDMATALVTAAVLVLIEQPAYLFYSGFQFSFGAITAVLLIVPVLEDTFPKLFSGCISINLATLPIYLYNYYYFPLISVFLNLYIIPLMSFLLAAALIAVAGCAVYIPLGRLIAVPVHLILRLYEISCNAADRVPFNRLVTGKPSAFAIIMYLIIVSAVLVFHARLTKLMMIMGLLFACIMLTTSLRSGVDITMLDVGQGDSIFITDNCGTDILIDGGSTDISDVGTYRIAPFLYSRGVASLDAVFITHTDADHYNGILEILRDGGLNTPRINTLYLTSSTHLMGGEAYDHIIEAARNAGVRVCSVSAGDVFRSGTLMFTCLYPDETCKGLDTNDESLVLDMEYLPGKGKDSKIHMLFTGDLGGEGEAALTEKLKKSEAGAASPADADNEDGAASGTESVFRILKIAHHGSKFSTLDPFLDAYRPGLVLISAGRDNSYGHPNDETLERLNDRDITHFCTIDHGALTVHINGDNSEVIPFLK